MTSSMSMSGMASMTASATTSATSAASTGMSMSMGGSDSTCKISMLWNWYTIDACFLSPSWHIKNNGMFAASCIGVVLLTMSLELMRRVSKEYDIAIQRKFQQAVASQAADFKRRNNSDSSLVGPQMVTFRATPLQQLIRAVLHAVTFGIAYIVMLLAMYYNGYIIICIFSGAGLGKFVFDWMILKAPIGGRTVGDMKTDTVCDDPTICCG